MLASAVTLILFACLVLFKEQIKFMECEKDDLTLVMATVLYTGCEELTLVNPDPS